MKTKCGMVMSVMMSSGIVSLMLAVLVKAGGMPWPSG